MIKIRMSTWYWGNYWLHNSKEPIPTDFEEYKENEHGWHHSEEFSKGRLVPYAGWDHKKPRKGE